MTGRHDGLPHPKLSSSCFCPSQEVVPFNLAAFCISFGMYISRMKAIQVFDGAPSGNSLSKIVSKLSTS
jgi:hypothetical protein